MKKKDSWELGEKIREVETDRHQHKKSLIIGLILSNLLLIIASVYFIVMVKVWPLIVMLVVFIALCIIYSFITYKRHDTCHTYTIYDNCIIVHSVWADRCIHLENIFLIETSRLRRDIKHGTNALIIYEKKKSFIKTNMPYIAEDLDKLRDEILSLSATYRAKLKSQEEIEE